MDPSVIAIIQSRNIHCVLLQEQLINARSRKSFLELDVINLIANHVLFMHDCSSVPSTISIQADGTINFDDLENYSYKTVANRSFRCFFQIAMQLRNRVQLEEIKLFELLIHFEEFERLEDPFFFGKWEGKQKNETNELLGYANNLYASLEKLLNFYNRYAITMSVGFQ